MKIIGIYRIYNKINNKNYIGQSIDIFSRFQQHYDESFKSDYPLYSDIRKYGITNFIFIIEKTCKINELQFYEQYFIDFYNSIEQGYNQVNAIQSKNTQELQIDKIKQIIELLENSSLSYDNISEITETSYATVFNVNTCKSWTSLHNYINNIREERRKSLNEDSYSNQEGELNPNSKLTEANVKEIIELLLNTPLTYKEIAKRYNVQPGAIKDINCKKSWNFLTASFNNNIRKSNKTIKR